MFTDPFQVREITFIFRKYKEWWNFLSQVKLLSINNHSLTYKVIPHCAECILLLFFVINALEVLWLPVPVHVQYNTNKNAYWAWLLRKSVFVVLEKKGTTQTKRADILGKEIHCTRRFQIQFLTAPLGMMVRLCRGLKSWLQAPFAASGFWFSRSPGLALSTGLHSLTSLHPPSLLPAATVTWVLSDIGLPWPWLSVWY